MNKSLTPDTPIKSSLWILVQKNLFDFVLEWPNYRVYKAVGLPMVLSLGQPGGSRCYGEHWLQFSRSPRNLRSEGECLYGLAFLCSIRKFWIGLETRPSRANSILEKGHEFANELPPLNVNSTAYVGGAPFSTLSLSDLSCHAFMLCNGSELEFAARCCCSVSPPEISVSSAT